MFARKVSLWYRKYGVYALCLLTFASLTGCGVSQPSSSNSPKSMTSQGEETPALTVTVSLLPQKYFVEKIGGKKVKVNVMITPGESEETYEPKPEQLKQLSQSKAYFTIGFPFEQLWLDRFKSVNSQLLLIDAGKNITKLTLDDYVHDHHQGNETQEKMTLDPHIWLSPKLVKTQAKTISETLISLDPQNKVYYETNLQTFLKEIDQLDQSIQQQLAPLKNKTIMVYHPTWSYFCQDYQLQSLVIEKEGTQISPQELENLIKIAKEKQIKAIFTQPEHSQKEAQIIAHAIGAKVIMVNPMAENWADNLRSIAHQFSTP